MKGYAVLAPGEHGWLEREKPTAGPMDAVVRPIAVAPCSSDTHTMHMGSTTGSPVILGHEAVAEVVEVGALVRGFRPGDIVVVPCVTPTGKRLPCSSAARTMPMTMPAWPASNI